MNIKSVVKKYGMGLFMAMMVVGMTGCSSSNGQENKETPSKQEETSKPESQEKTELIVYAAASMTETLTEIKSLYEEEHKNIELVFNFDSSGTLKTQITEGGDCDIFISAAQKQMNAIDLAAKSGNDDKLDFVKEGTRINLLENKVVLIVTKNNSKNITSFEDLNTDKVDTIVIGNSDVPVGQYSQSIMEYMGIWDTLNQEAKLTFATNVKEVITHVEEEAVDCGIVYSTDAAVSDKVSVVATAPENSHPSVTYPLAIMKHSKHMEEAEKFVAYLQSETAKSVFEKVGFVVLQ